MSDDAKPYVPNVRPVPRQQLPEHAWQCRWGCNSFDSMRKAQQHEKKCSKRPEGEVV